MCLLYMPSGPVTRFLDAETISAVLCSVKIKKSREQSFPVSLFPSLVYTQYRVEMVLPCIHLDVSKELG